MPALEQVHNIHHTIALEGLDWESWSRAPVACRLVQELARCQNELKAVSNHNLQQLKRLLKAAKEEMARQEVRNKLQAADNEVMDAYRKISQARAKKKPPTKKERDQAWKALKEREIIIKQLESI